VDDEQRVFRDIYLTTPDGVHLVSAATSKHSTYRKIERNVIERIVRERKTDASPNLAKTNREDAQIRFRQPSRTGWQKQSRAEQRNRDADDYYRREIGRAGRAELIDVISLPYVGNGNGYS